MNKNTVKILILLVAFAAAVSLVTFTAFAEGENITEPTPIFEVIAADGTQKLTGVTEREMRVAVSEAEDGDTVRMLTDIEINGGIKPTATEEAPKTVNFDLAGHKLYSLTKRTIFAAGHYTTFNIYSSLPGAVVFVSNLANTSLGGNIFTIAGASAVINAGEYTDGDVTYPGSNISTYSSCLIDIVPNSTDPDHVDYCDAASSVNLNGGNYHSICSDYSGFVVPRGGEATFNIKNANLLMFETRAPINAMGGFCKLNFENCVILNSAGASVNFFNNTGTAVYMKDCITNYELESSVSVGKSVTLEGRNVFASSENAELTLINSTEPVVLARTDAEYELNGGGKTAYVYPKESAPTAHYDEIMPDLKKAAAILPVGATETCIFVNGNQTATEVWDKNAQIIPPFNIGMERVEGVYKRAWVNSYDELGNHILTAGYLADYNVKIGAVYEDGNFYFNVYIPDYVIDEGMLDFRGVLIGEDDFATDAWEHKEVDGKGYYYAFSAYIDETNLNDAIKVVIPMFTLDDKYVTTSWTFTAKEYIDLVLATEADGVYTEDEYSVIHRIVEDFVPEVEEDVAE